MGYTNRYWMCPFYKWDEKNAIHCEGGSMIKLPKQALREYASCYCASQNWKMCTVCKAILKTYEED